jgi:hypothetical protein
MVEKEMAIGVSVLMLFIGMGFGVAFTVLAGIYRGVKVTTAWLVTDIAQTEAEIKQHNAELEARIKRGCRQTVGNI